MKKVDYELFAKFQMPHSLSVKGDDIYFSVKTADLKGNRYKNNLYRIKDGKTVKLTSKGDVGSFNLLDDGIYFISNREDEKETVRPKTHIYRLPYDGGEAVLEMTLDYMVHGIRFLSKDEFYFTATYDFLYEKYLKDAKGDHKKAQEMMKEEKDYQVIDEVPFYFNGAGYVNGTRSHLFYYKKGKVTKLTENVYENCNMCSLCDGVLYFTVEELKGKSELGNVLFRLDSPKGERVKISLDGTVEHYFAATLPNGKEMILANLYRAHGLNENPKLIFDRDFLLNEDGMLSFGNSTLTDVVCEAKELGKDFLYKDNCVYYLTTIDDSCHIIEFNSVTGKNRVITKVKGNITSCDMYKDGFVICALRDKGPEVYTVSMDGKEKQITKFNDRIFKDYYYQKPEELTFINEVGTEIKGWVIKPANFDEKKKYPMVLDIHGGPKCVYSPAYFHEMQLWASRGFVVCFCNPTGGDGKGDEFMDIFGHYGEQDYQDIMTFVSTVLKKNKYIDKKKLFVTGGSYGGFMTNWIIGHTDIFRAAASQRSISNWTSFYNTSDIGNNFVKDQIKADPWTNYEKVWQHSPLKYADKAVTPTLFIHSDEDYRCPLPEGMQMFYALRDHNVETRMCIFHGENHELSRNGKPKHRVRRLKEITEWFESHM